MSNYIRFGDIIYLEFDNLLLFANDLYNPILHLVSTQNIAQKSFRNGLFQLYPNLSYKDTNQVDLLQDQLDLLKSLNPEENFAAEFIEKEIQLEKKTLENRESKRDELNQKMYEESKGKTILYGHKVQLLHVESQCFVSLAEFTNHDGSNLINLELTKKGSKNLFFTFMPKLAFNQEGQNVEYDTPIKLLSYHNESLLTKGCELDLSKVRSVLNPETNELCNSGDDFPKIEPRRKEPIYEGEGIFHTGMSLKEVPENAYIRKFISIEDDTEAEKRKAFKNGDYLRITNDTHFLTIYQSRDSYDKEIFFQSFKENYEYRYNNIYTLFQIYEADDGTSNEEETSNQEQNASKIPEGHILEHEEEKKYTLKHVISGQYLCVRHGALTLLKPSEVRGEEKLSLLIRGNSNADDNQIDKNSIVQFKFYTNRSDEELFMTIGKRKYLGDPVFEINTHLFFGFKNCENYLNKFLRPERFEANVNPQVDEELSSFKLLKVDEEEFTSIILAESLTNQLQKFTDMFEEFRRKKSNSSRNLKELNEGIRQLADICLQFSKEMYDEEYSEDIEDVLDPHILRQNLLREFRIFNLMFAILAQFTSNFQIFEIIQSMKKGLEENDNSRLSEVQHDSFIEEILGIDENHYINFTNLVKLITCFKKIILVSFKKNHLNHYYCSQFARVPIRGLIYRDVSVTALASPEEQFEIMESLLVLCKEGLWDSDLDALGQLNFYENDFFSCLDKQTDYHTIYLRLLNHISNSKAPNLQNTVRDNFVFNYLSKTDNLTHILPAIQEERDKVYLIFRRKRNKEKTIKLCLNDYSQAGNKEMDDQTKELFSYFKEGLELVYAIASVKSKGFDFKIIRYYTYPALTKILDILKIKSQFRDIRIEISDLISLIHQGYFAVPFTQLPNQLQILPAHHDERINSVVKEINQSIQNAMKTLISEPETKFIRDEGADGDIRVLKSIVNSEEQTNEILRLIEAYSPTDKLEQGRIILDGIRKIFESPLDFNFEFFKKSREAVILLIKRATEKNKKSSHDFIKYALEVFDIMEERTLVFAASEITDTLIDKVSDPLNKDNKNRARLKQKQPSLDSKSDDDNSPRLVDGKKDDKVSLKKKQIAPMDSLTKELSNREKSEDVMMVNAVEVLARKWKTGERFVLGSNKKIQQLDHVGAINKKIKTSETLTMLLDIISLNQDYLMSDVILQLKKVSAFESGLYKELDKLIILQDYENIKKTSEIVRITLRLNEISREVEFCKNNQISIERTKVESLLKEIYEFNWKLLFVIYDASKHFQFNDPGTLPEERFRKAFEVEKNIEFDHYLKLKPRAINKTFQKIFNILKTYETLLNVLNWLLYESQKSDDELELMRKTIRLDILIIIAFLYNNKENQLLLSNETGVIKLLYNDHFLTQSSDVLFIFAEIIRDNKRLLKLPMKYQYDITLQSFVTPVEKPIVNDSDNCNIAVSLASFHFLCNALLPIEVFNPLAILKDKWLQISQIGNFTNLNLLENINEKLSFNYFEIRETMLASLENFDRLASNSKNLNEIQSFLGFPQWIEFFKSPNYLLQFELKNILCKYLIKLYFEQDKKIKLLENNESCLALVSSLIADIIFFMKYITKMKKQNNSSLQKFVAKPNFITKHENYQIIQDLYVNANDIDLENRTISLFLEDIKLYRLLREYIYDGCFGLLSSILINEAEFCSEVQDINDEYKTIMGYSLGLIDELSKCENDNRHFPHSKVEKFFSKASAKKAYFPFRQKVIELTNKFQDKFGKKNEDLNKDNFQSPENAAENFARYINPLQNFKKENKEQNLKQVAEHIAEHPKNHEIMKEILKYFKNDLHKIEHEEIVFILRLLRKYIEIENKNNPGDDPLYMWKEISHSDLKKVEKIQNLYRELGLSQMISLFFEMNDRRIFKETILLSLAYMYGGNRAVQKDFYENFKEDEDNIILSQIGNTLKRIFGKFRSFETKRINALYTSTQKTLFNYFKGKRQEEVDLAELQIKISKLKIDPKFLTHAEKTEENELFMLILTFLQGLCEGQYQDMQLYLREQKVDDRLYPKSFDFLSFLRHSMNSYYKVLSRYNLPIGTKIMDLIIELIQGEVHENITVFLHKTFIYDLCRVLTDFNTRYHTLPRGFGLNIFHENYRNFKSKIIFLFKTMLENKDEENTKILTEHLDRAGLMQALEDLMSEFCKRKNIHKSLKSMDRFIWVLNNEDFKDILGDAINIYIIFRYIYDDPNDFNENMRDLIKDMDKEKQDFLDKIIFTVFRKLVTSIEIVVDTKSNPLMRIWFPVIAMCHYLNKDAKTNFIKYVDRSNSQTKISGLIESSQEFLPQMETDYQARNRLLGFNMLNIYYSIRFITNLLALVITIINIATYKYEDDDTFQEDRYTNVTLGMNAVQIVIAASLVILWITLLRKRNQAIEWERYVDQNVKKNGFLPPTLKNKLENGEYKHLTKEECMTILTLKGANSEEFKEMELESLNFKEISLTYYVIEFYFAIASKEFFWHVCYLGITIGSLFHPLAAVFQIMDIAFRVDTIKQIYSSISRNVYQFLWTLFLLLLTNVMYSFIGFFFMNGEFIGDDDSSLCETAFSCFLNVLNLGLRSGGGIAEVIGAQPYSTEEIGLFIGRVIFDLSFFIIMIILLLNLIFGMIIDAFGDLRDQRTSNEEDEKNVCFICGIERSEFEKHINFEEHTIEEHNIWSYVYYIAYLVDKQKTTKNEMTDIENFVIEKYSISNYEWVPIAQSLELEKILNQEKVEKEDEIESILNVVGEMKQNVIDLDTQFRVNLINEVKEGVREIKDKLRNNLKNELMQNNEINN